MFTGDIQCPSGAQMNAYAYPYIFEPAQINIPLDPHSLYGIYKN